MSPRADPSLTRLAELVFSSPTLTDIAREAGVSISYVSQVARGTSKPSPKLKAAASRVLDRPIAEIFPVEGDPPRRRLDMSEPLWTIEQTADFLALPTSTLYRWNHERRELVGFKCGRRLRYSPTDVRAWLEATRSKPTATAF